MYLHDLVAVGFFYANARDIKIETHSNHVINRIAFLHEQIFPDFETPPGYSRLLHIIYCSFKMADGAADLIDTDSSRLNGKCSSKITLWRSSRLKYL